VMASSDLAALLAEQERAVSFARSAAEEVEAPSGLRARVTAPKRARRQPMRRPLALVGATAAIIVAVGIGVAAVRPGDPQTLHAALASTELAPSAHGDAELTKTSSGWRIYFDVTGLPRRDGGRYYQAWLRNAAGTTVPVGTFNEGRNVTLWAGVSPKEFTTLTVTREAADGNQASSGEKVLIGTVGSQPSIRRTTCCRARYSRLITVPSRIRRLFAASLYERPATSTATRTSR
jgi:hypothetical protein